MSNLGTKLRLRYKHCGLLLYYSKDSIKVCSISSCTIVCNGTTRNDKRQVVEWDLESFRSLGSFSCQGGKNKLNII